MLACSDFVYFELGSWTRVVRVCADVPTLSQKCPYQSLLRSHHAPGPQAWHPATAICLRIVFHLCLGDDIVEPWVIDAFILA